LSSDKKFVANSPKQNLDSNKQPAR